MPNYKQLIAEYSHKINGNVQYYLLAKNKADKAVYAKQVAHFTKLKKRYATAQAKLETKNQLQLSL